MSLRYQTLHESGFNDLDCVERLVSHSCTYNLFGRFKKWAKTD